MKRLVWIALVACGGVRNSGGGGDGGEGADAASSDAPPSCRVAVDFDPVQPFIDPIAPIRATATTIGGGNGVLQWIWSVTNAQSGQPVSLSTVALDGSAV